ncbi:MAG TPA: hypothetical protein VKX49_20195 [Bryobacteraceae bacterium]|nr:hypothetical protein [Bryobacteraceae bacterium]
MMRGFLSLLPLAALTAAPASQIKTGERVPKLSGELLTGEATVQDTNSWKQLEGFGDPDAAHLILLDRTSKVAWLSRGAFDKTAFQTLCTKVSDLVSAQ